MTAGERIDPQRNPGPGMLHARRGDELGHRQYRRMLQIVRVCGDDQTVEILILQQRFDARE